MGCDLSKHLALQVFPESGRSRTRTWDLFLIRKTFCPLQSSQLALNPCKRVRQHDRKTTGDDWALQAGGPIVAPRPKSEERPTYDPEADIVPTIRSDPDAPEAGRCAPAGIASTAAGLGAWSRSSITWPWVPRGERAAVSELARELQPSACHAASTASLPFRRRWRRGCGEAGAAAADLVASQRLRASREMRGERPT